MMGLEFFREEKFGSGNDGSTVPNYRYRDTILLRPPPEKSAGFFAHTHTHTYYTYMYRTGWTHTIYICCCNPTDNPARRASLLVERVLSKK